MISGLVIFLSCIYFSLVVIRANVYTDQFVVEMDGGVVAAKRFAKEHGFKFLGKVIDDHYHLQHRKIAKRSTEHSKEHHQLLSQHPKVKSFSQQVAKKRSKRDIYYSKNLNDPKWPEMWYLNRGKGFDMNVEAAWGLGVTGKGVVVTILDDGLERDHPELMKNFDKKASYDINSHDFDPQPRYDLFDTNRHGTRCAGEVAASANNSVCSVGIAFNARVGGIRMLDGDVTDAVEARALTHSSTYIHIYSASWGPDDDGKTVDGPGGLTLKAFRDGVRHGRHGLGSIFIWASGNGGREYDNCNCDGYTNAIWTLSISSATENGLVPWYSEACSSTLATTYSSGSSGEKQIITTDLRHSCTMSHTGTSASAPLAAAICALVLEANKNLTWRDMQHLVVRTANPRNLFAKDWSTNGVGRNVSHSFGYGMMDAAAMVRIAKDWVTVSEQIVCKVGEPQFEGSFSQFPRFINPRTKVDVFLEVKCKNISFLEHVQAHITMSTPRRGDVHLYLMSPLGTRVTLLAQRPNDNSRAGFAEWPFMSVHTWGENPNGIWKLEIHNDGRNNGRANLKKWELTIYGTKENPDRRAQSEPNLETIAQMHKKPIDPYRNYKPVGEPITVFDFGNSGPRSRNALDIFCKYWYFLLSMVSLHINGCF